LSLFVDEVSISAESGRGGNGALSFRRERYVPKGGPDGGDGGDGGACIIVTHPQLNSLGHLVTKRHHKAGNGKPGAGRNKHGGDGADAVIEVPLGTLVWDRETGELLADLKAPDSRLTVVEGGRGGKGNAHFKSSTHQTPRFSQPGEPGKRRELKLELRIIAEVGIVGFPNAGKSSLLAALTAAKPEVAAYPFTTKQPNLGVLTDEWRRVIIADIPGLVEGASEGAGMGFRFLRHIARTQRILYAIDVTDPIDPGEALQLLRKELATFDPSLLERPAVLIGTKMDLPEAEAGLARLKEAEGAPEVVVGTSALTGEGLDKLAAILLEDAEK
jgi:GTPase